MNKGGIIKAGKGGGAGSDDSIINKFEWKKGWSNIKCVLTKFE